MPLRVGTLDTLGLAVYQNADGTLFFREEGVRVKVHGNARWTTSSGEARRGQVRAAPFVARQDSWGSSEVSGSDSEGEGLHDSEADDRRQLAEAIAASLAGQAGPTSSRPSAVDATAAARNDAEEREQIALAIAASLGGGSGSDGGGPPTELAAASSTPAAAATPPQCSICMEDLGTGGQVQALRCSHSFHRACIARWLRSSRTCPTCRERA